METLQDQGRVRRQDEAIDRSSPPRKFTYPHCSREAYIITSIARYRVGDFNEGESCEENYVCAFIEHLFAHWLCCFRLPAPAQSAWPLRPQPRQSKAL